MLATPSLVKCDGSVVNVPGQQSDWGTPCLIGFRASNSPAVGTALGCYCLPGSLMEEDVLLENNGIKIPEENDSPSLVLSTVISGSREITMNFSNSGLAGNGVLKIYNMSGQLVCAKSLFNIDSNPYMRIETETALEPGVYIISIQSDNAFLSQKVFFRGE